MRGLAEGVGDLKKVLSGVKTRGIVGEDDKEFDFIDNQDFIKKTLDKLTEVEKQIILGRYFEQKTQVALAKELNISQMTVSRLEKKALAKFREELNM